MHRCKQSEQHFLEYKSEREQVYMNLCPFCRETVDDNMMIPGEMLEPPPINWDKLKYTVFGGALPFP